MLLSEEIVCLSYFEVKPEYRDTLINALLNLISPTRDEPGCLQYDLILDNENPNFLIIIEKFINKNALDHHEKQPYIVKFVENMMNKYCNKVTWHVGREIYK